MNYTGRPSISGCRPVLSLYPTHRFCQYLLLIFITFTNSSLFNRAFSTNSRRASQSKALPLGELAGASPTERARLLTANPRHSDSIALTKACLSLRLRLFRAGLALSVTFGDTSPKGRGFGRPQGAKRPPFGDCSSGRGSFLLGEPMDSFASTFITFIICHSPQKSSTVRKVYSHSSLGISCIFLANYMLYWFCGSPRVSHGRGGGRVGLFSHIFGICRSRCSVALYLQVA